MRVGVELLRYVIVLETKTSALVSVKRLGCCPIFLDRCHPTPSVWMKQFTVNSERKEEKKN